jgi:hypothetical protein
VTSDVHWNTPGALGSQDRYDLAVYSGCVRVTLDASAPDGPQPPRPSAPSDAADEPAGRLEQGVSLILDGIEKRLTRR